VTVPSHIARPTGSRLVSEDAPRTGHAGLDKAAFFAVMAAFPTGVTIVTTLDDHGGPRGLTSNAVCSVSADPPLLLVCIDRRSTTLAEIQRRQRFVVNFLGAARGDLSNRFASRHPDRFAGVPWRAAGNGMPWLYQDTIAHAECAVQQAVVAGDHVVVMGAVTGGSPPDRDASPLIYFRRSYATWPAQ